MSRPQIILTPPLTGCTTLAQLYEGAVSIILDVDAHAPKVKGANLVDRLARMRDWYLSLEDGAPVVCMPALLDDDMAAHVVAAVLIPPATFFKRASNPDIGMGHKVAALTWRDAAIRFTTQSPLIPVYSALQAVPIIQHVLGVRGGFLQPPT